MAAPPLREKCAGKVCAIGGCGKPAEKRLLCKSHYARMDRGGRGPCSVATCGNKEAHGRKGMCEKHYLAKYRSANTNPCARCGRPSIAKGLCAAHYSRAKRGYEMDKPLMPRYGGRACSQPECAKPARKLGFCDFHYHRHHEGVPLNAPKRSAKGSFINSYGYRVLVLPDRKKRLEHRVLMAASLGRELAADETVHHKNGHRADNRLVKGHELACPGACCNLELWSSRQPKGQRVADKVAWARELLSLYGPLYPGEA